MVCFSSVKTWNALLKSVRECDKLNVSIRNLKNHHFNVAFDDVPDLKILYIVLFIIKFFRSQFICLKCFCTTYPISQVFVSVSHLKG